MLDYEARIPQYQPTPEDRVWLRRRLAYYGLHVLLFLAIVYRVGPNLLLFHSPFSAGPADYVPLAKEYAPIIAAIKAYNRDFGKLPEGNIDLPVEYRPPNWDHYVGDILGTTSITFPLSGGTIVLEYEFSAAKEGWIIHSPRYDGPIPAPNVPAVPKPSTLPSS